MRGELYYYVKKTTQRKGMIQLDHIHKTYGDKTVLNDISFRIEAGEVFGLLGTNGAGKTTLMHILCGQIRPSSGQVQINSMSPTCLDAKRLIGIAPQTLAFYPTLTVHDNMRFFSRIYDLPASRVEASLAAVSLQDRLNDRAASLSGGMQRRLNLAIALLHNPTILLLDEPTVGVDAQSRIELLDIVAKLRRAGHTIIYTTHYLEEAEKLCDRIAVIDKGHIRAIGTLDELVNEYGHAPVLSWSVEGQTHHRELKNEVKDIQSVLTDFPNARQFNVTRANLEHVFITLTEQ